MLREVQNYIPVLTSEAGSCLTTANWMEVNVHAAAYYLDSLLLKPGAEILKKNTKLSDYLGWSGTIILNASRLLANKEGIFTLSSPYDGSKIKFSYSELFELILKLKPDALILPKNTLHDFPEFLDSSNSEIIPFIAAEDLMKHDCHKPHGVYINFVDANSNDVIDEHLSRWSHLPRYALGSINIELIRSLQAQGLQYIESDEPARLAFEGQVYCGSGTVDLTDSQTEMQFETIDPHCLCPTCLQQLSKAYLHHLFLQTPLLCQRFLIQHNVYQV